MRKVIIADDELHIRNLLKYLIHWNELGLSCVAEYDNGADVVAHIEREHVDIVITDVQMPEMDGLNMIRQVREKDPECRFVVISGYRDFDYAQTSVKLGVSDYILKPIDEGELNDALAGIVGENGRAAQERAERNERRKGFLPVLRGQRLVEDAEQANREFGFHFAPSGCYLVIWMAICRAKKQENISERVLKKIALLKKRLEGCCYDMESFMLSNLAHVVLVQCASERKAELVRALDGAYQEMLHSDLAGDSLRYYLAVGKAVDDLRQIRESTVSARFFITGRIFYGTRRIYIADNMQLGEVWQCQSIQIPYETGRRLESALERREEASIKQAIAAAFAYFRAEYPENAALCFSVSRQIGELLVRKLEQFGVNPGETRSILEELEYRLENSDTEEQIQNVTGNICMEAVHRLLVRKTDQNVYVLQAKAYIDTHYAENISLSFLAEQMHINPAYLSSLFKNEIGVNYQDYLTAVRIDKAKDLLSAGEMNLSQIANAVGYGSARYFSKLFESQTGLKPGEYRRLRLRGLE